MKISKNIRSLYEINLTLFSELGSIIDKRMLEHKNKNWHYLSRLKAEESFCLKLESGNHKEFILEDFFACTLVVENYASINLAIQTIESFLIINRRKPKLDGSTHLQPYDFSFDDLRLYCSLKIPEHLQEKYHKFEGLEFELQIKTFLQHAWGIATHDLIYKGDFLDWGASRIAYQTRALLENAELTIHNVTEMLKNTEKIQKSHLEFDYLKEILDVVSSYWQEDALPRDKKRLIENIFKIIKISNDPKAENGISHGEYLRKILNDYISEVDVMPRNVDIYHIILFLLLAEKDSKVLKYIQKNQRNKIFIDDLENFDLDEVILKKCINAKGASYLTGKFINLKIIE